jgi:hypothetical protein
MLPCSTPRTSALSWLVQQLRVSSWSQLSTFMDPPCSLIFQRIKPLRQGFLSQEQEHQLASLEDSPHGFLQESVLMWPSARAAIAKLWTGGVNAASLSTAEVAAISNCTTTAQADNTTSKANLGGGDGSAGNIALWVHRQRLCMEDILTMSAVSRTRLAFMRVRALDNRLL